MELADLIEKIDRFQARVLDQMPAIADEIALNMLALIKRRIVDERQGLPGEQYSIKPMLATKDQFVVKSAFKQTKEEVTILKRKKDKNNFMQAQIGKAVSSKSGRSFLTKKVKRPLWIKFPGATKAVPVMLLPQGYKEFREIQGRQAAVVDLSLSGKMWQGTTIKARAQRDHNYIVIMGGNNKEAQDKLNWNTDHYGPFLTANKAEQQLSEQIFNNRLQSIYNSVILSNG